MPIWTGRPRPAALHTSEALDLVASRDDDAILGGEARTNDSASDGGGGGGGTTRQTSADDDDEAGNGRESRRSRYRNDPEVRRVLRRHRGDPFAAIHELYADNHRTRRRAANEPNVDLDTRAILKENSDLRDAIRDLEHENEELTGKMPKGAVVLTKDEAAFYNELRKLNLNASEIAKRVSEHPTLAATIEQSKREDGLRKSAKIVGWNDEALVALAKREPVHVEMRHIERETEKGGKKEKVEWPYVRPISDDKAELVPMDEYGEKNWKVFLPSLLDLGEASSASGGRASGSSVTLPRQQTGKSSAPERDRSRTPATTGAAAKHVQSQYRVPPSLQRDKNESDAK